MICFICKEEIGCTLFKCCDKDCCSIKCQSNLIKLNTLIDPKLIQPETWIKLYDNECNYIQDNNFIELHMLDTNRKKKLTEKENSVIIYKNYLFCCSY